MKLAGLIIFLFCSELLAVVYHQTDQRDAAFSAVGSSVEIPVTKSPDAELGLLKQLKLKVHSGEATRQHIWDKVRKCEGCHAFKLYAGNGYLPILQGQNLEYLFSKLLMFKNRQRSYHPLARYIDSLSNDELMDISVFYAEQLSDLKRTLVPAKLLDINDAGSVVSIKPCADCHGATGNGDQLVPAISGQNKGYLSYRIREIADDNSNIHIFSDAPVSCKVTDVTIRQSRQLASLLSVVVDKRRAEQGAQVYRQKCAECHDADGSVMAEAGLTADWSKHLLQGTRLLVNNTMVGSQHKFIAGRYLSFSSNEMEDAIHYMINQLQGSL